MSTCTNTGQCCMDPQCSLHGQQERPDIHRRHHLQHESRPGWRFQPEPGSMTQETTQDAPSVERRSATWPPPGPPPPGQPPQAACMQHAPMGPSQMPPGIAMQPGASQIPARLQAPPMVYADTHHLRGSIPIPIQNIFKIPSDAWDASKWEISSKQSKTLESYAGTASSYRSRASRMKTHLLSSFNGWMRLLQYVESQKQPLTWDWQSTNPTVDGVKLDLITLSQTLWAFDIDKLKETLCSARIALAGGQ